MVVAARDLMYARIAFEGMAAELLQAPVWPEHRHFGSEMGQANYLDVLARIGFADPAKLGAIVGGWIALIDLVRPDVIVADHSPALLLAAHIRGLATVQVGSGFTMPPLDYDRLPPIRADRAAIMPEERFLSAAALIAGQHGSWIPKSLVEILKTDKRVVFGCPELDPYAPFRREPLCLPPEALPQFSEPPVEPRIFVYLGPEMPKLDQLLQVLTELGVPLEVYLRGEVSALGRFLALRGHVVHDRPPAFAEVLPKVSHVISAGGAFTAHAALAAGRPMLALPLHGEAELNISALERLGAGKRLSPWKDERALRSALLAFLRDHALLRAARHWAKVLAQRSQPDGVKEAGRAIAQCLDAPRAVTPLAARS